MEESKIVAAVGTATATEKKGNPIELLMAAEVLKVSEEASAIWKDPDLSVEEKSKRIKELTSDDNVRARKLAARSAYKDQLRKKAEEEGAKAQVEKLKEAAKSL